MKHRCCLHLERAPVRESKQPLVVQMALFAVAFVVLAVIVVLVLAVTP